MNALRKSLVPFLESAKRLLDSPQLTPALSVAPHFASSQEVEPQPVKDFLSDLKDGIVQAVQTNRRSLERRQWRRIGMPQFQAKPRRDLKCCVVCGNFHEGHTLCGHCYAKTKTESDVVKQAIADSNEHLKPIERDVVVKYEGETVDATTQKKIVEIPKKRPSIFCKNLLEKENQV